MPQNSNKPPATYPYPPPTCPTPTATSLSSSNKSNPHPSSSNTNSQILDSNFMKKNMSSTIWIVIYACFVVLFSDPTTALGDGGVVKEGGGGLFPVPVPAVRHGTVVKKDQRWPVAGSEFGEISAVKVSDGKDGFYHLQFITMEPNSLFLPVHLHSDMVFYVDSGNGTLSWTILEEDGDNLRQVKLREGDVYRLPTGSFFYIQSNLESNRHKLRIHAIFSDAKDELLEGSSSGAYSSVRDLVLGFDSKILQAALNVKEEVIEELKRGERQAIVHGVAETVEGNMLEIHYEIMRAFFGGRMNINGMLHLSKKKDEKEDKKKDKKEDKKKDDKDKPYNVLDAKRDVENCNGWSLVVTNQQLDALNNSNFGVFMVNLSRGAMMGPHWNPMTAEIAVVLSGRGMVHVVCPSATSGMDCKNSRFKVEEGDVFVVPRYHPMAQMSFNDGALVFVGFTTTTKNNHPQFLVGRASVFQALDKKVLAASLGVSNTTMDQVLSAQKEAIILECVSCAEEEERLMEEEIEREKEEAKKREEEAKRRKEEEEAKRQEAEKKKEEEARRREEEAERARKEEEEAARRQEEEKRRREEEEEARRREEETRREQEEQRKREEEAARQREEEKRRQEEEAARRQEEEAAARQREEEKRQQEEEARRQEEEARKTEEEAARKREEEEAARRQQEEAAKQWQRQQEEEAKRKQEEAAKQWQRQQEEEAKRKQEEQAAKEWQRQQEEAAKRKQEEEAARQQEEEAAKQWQQQQQQDEAAKQWQRQQEEAAKRKQEEEAAKQWQQQQQEEAAKRKQEEEAAKQWQRQQEEEAARRHQGGGGGGGGTAGWEGEAGSRQEEEMARRQREAEAAAQRGGGGGGWQSNGRYEN